ncbi:hypothetical protein ACHAXT_010026 [Thalassiosira profunda]
MASLNCRVDASSSEEQSSRDQRLRLSKLDEDPCSPDLLQRTQPRPAADGAAEVGGVPAVGPEVDAGRSTHWNRREKGGENAALASDPRAQPGSSDGSAPSRSSRENEQPNLSTTGPGVGVAAASAAGANDPSSEEGREEESNDGVQRKAPSGLLPPQKAAEARAARVEAAAASSASVDAGEPTIGLQLLVGEESLSPSPGNDVDILDAFDVDIDSPAPGNNAAGVKDTATSENEGNEVVGEDQIWDLVNLPDKDTSLQVNGDSTLPCINDIAAVNRAFAVDADPTLPTEVQEVDDERTPSTEEASFLSEIDELTRGMAVEAIQSLPFVLPDSFGMNKGVSLPVPGTVTDASIGKENASIIEESTWTGPATRPENALVTLVDEQSADLLSTPLQEALVPSVEYACMGGIGMQDPSAFMSMETGTHTWNCGRCGFANFAGELVCYGCRLPRGEPLPSKGSAYANPLPPPLPPLPPLQATTNEASAEGVANNGPSAPDGVLPSQALLPPGDQRRAEAVGFFRQFAMLPIDQWPVEVRRRLESRGNVVGPFVAALPETAQILELASAEGNDVAYFDSDAHELGHVCFAFANNFASDKNDEAVGEEGRLLWKNIHGLVGEKCLRTQLDLLKNIAVEKYNVPGENADRLVPACTAFLNRTMVRGRYDLHSDKSTRNDYDKSVTRTDALTCEVMRKLVQLFADGAGLVVCGDPSYEAVIGEAWLKGLGLLIPQTGPVAHPAKACMHWSPQQECVTAVDVCNTMMASALGRAKALITEEEAMKLMPWCSIEGGLAKAKKIAMDNGGFLWAQLECEHCGAGVTTEGSVDSLSRAKCCNGGPGAQYCVGRPVSSNSKRTYAHKKWKVMKIIECLNCCKEKPWAMKELAEYGGCFCYACKPDHPANRKRKHLEEKKEEKEERAAKKQRKAEEKEVEKQRKVEDERRRRLDAINGKLNTLANQMLNGKRQSDEFVGALASLAQNNSFGMSASDLMQVVSRKVYDYLKRTESQEEIAAIGANPSVDAVSLLVERRLEKAAEKKENRCRRAKDAQRKRDEQSKMSEEEKAAATCSHVECNNAL